MDSKVWPLLRLKADSEDELKAKYLEVYMKEYVDQEVYDFQGNRVIFSYSQFEHAFSESDDYRNSHGVHDRFSKKRARYILWIKKVLAKESGGVVYHLEHRSETRKKKGKRVVARIYAVVEEKYIVVLDQKEGALYFITGVPHDANSYKRMIERSALLRSYEVPSSHGD